MATAECQRSNEKKTRRRVKVNGLDTKPKYITYFVPSLYLSQMNVDTPYLSFDNIREWKKYQYPPCRQVGP